MNESSFHLINLQNIHALRNFNEKFVRMFHIHHVKHFNLINLLETIEQRESCDWQFLKCVTFIDQFISLWRNLSFLIVPLTVAEYFILIDL